MKITPGTIVVMCETRNLSLAEDEVPLVVLRTGDHLQAIDVADAGGWQEFTHLPSGITNIRLHRDDVMLP